MVRACRRHFKTFRSAGRSGGGAYDRGINLPEDAPPAREVAGSPRSAPAGVQCVAAASSTPGACQPPPNAWISATAAACRFDISWDSVWRAESAVT